MDAERTHPNKKWAETAHQIPSFVYRQDGYELSYVIGDSIHHLERFVNSQVIPLRRGEHRSSVQYTDRIRRSLMRIPTACRRTANGRPYVTENGAPNGSAIIIMPNKLPGSPS